MHCVLPVINYFVHTLLLSTTGVDGTELFGLCCWSVFICFFVVADVGKVSMTNCNRRLGSPVFCFVISCPL
jgi:hypothetical protein